jgi:very-short-patch-repair endonuclease
MRDATGHTPLDRELAELAKRQHAVVALRQLAELGLSASGVRNRVEAGRLHPLYRGVYAVGHELLTTEGHWMAAVLACGTRAALSHRSAAELLTIRRRSGRVRIDITTRTRAGRRYGRIDVHAGRTLLRKDVAPVNGIPCTSVPRTLLDLADVSDQQAVNRDVERTEAARIFDLGAIDELLARSNGRRGVRRLQRAIAHHRETFTRSDIEDALLAICEKANLPRPRVNVWFPHLDIECDFVWHDIRLIVEADSYEYHGDRGAMERDRRRDRRLRADGWRVERFMWREILHEPEAVAEALRVLIAAERAA